MNEVTHATSDGICQAELPLILEATKSSTTKARKVARDKAPVPLARKVATKSTVKVDKEKAPAKKVAAKKVVGKKVIVKKEVSKKEAAAPVRKSKITKGKATVEETTVNEEPIASAPRVAEDPQPIAVTKPVVLETPAPEAQPLADKPVEEFRPAPTVSRGQERRGKQGKRGDSRKSGGPRNRDHEKQPDRRDHRGASPSNSEQENRTETAPNQQSAATDLVVQEKPRDEHRNSGPSWRNAPRHPQQRRPEIPETPPYEADGYFECSPRGFGFLRRKERAFFQTNTDVFVSPEMARNYGLREGLFLKGKAKRGPRGPQLIELESINGQDPAEWANLPEFEELTAVNPNKRILLETTRERLTTRVIDLMTPIGRGQRGLIVAPPRTGKTTLLKHIAEAARDQHPDLHLMILLIDERPEEVTDFKRSLPEAELFASSNDSDPTSHARVAHFAIERAKRMVEKGEHVIMVMDSITRLARASNNNMGRKGGKTMSGGIDSKALEFPRRLFAAARNTREAGSLTIIATALIETGSRMDDLIYQEFKGTGNMELVLNRRIAEQYFYPAVEIFKSGTRREELLLPAFQLEKIHFIRRGLSGHKPVEAIERLLSIMERFPSNNQMLVELKMANV